MTQYSILEYSDSCKRLPFDKMCHFFTVRKKGETFCVPHYFFLLQYLQWPQSRRYGAISRSYSWARDSRDRPQLAWRSFSRPTIKTY